MVYYPPSSGIGGSPGPTPFPANGGSVLNSPMFQGYDTGASMPSYVTAPSAIPTAPVSTPLMEQIAGSGPVSSPSVTNALSQSAPSVETAINEAAPRAGLLSSLRSALGRNWSQDAPAITGEEATGLLARTPYSLAPLAMTVGGGYLQSHSAPGSQLHSLGQGLSTGGAASGAGLLGGSVLAAAGAPAAVGALPLAAGGALGGLAGGYINSRLAAHDVNFGPFHWGTSPHAVDTLSGGDPTIQHLIGIATDQFQAKNIAPSDFTTIVKNAMLQHQMGADPKAIAADIQNNIQQAVQLKSQGDAQARQQVADNHRMLREQLAIAHLMQPDLQGINQSAQGLQESIKSAGLTGPMAAWGNLLGQSTALQGKRQSAAIQASELALPQIQALAAQIQAQNTAQQAANYYAARQSSSTGGSSLSSLLNQTQAPAAVGASGASGG